MKILPCDLSSDGRARMADGKPHVVGTAPADIARGNYTFGCHCVGRRPHTVILTLQQYNSLPRLSPREADELGLGWMFTEDLNVSIEDAQALEEYGVLELAARGRPEGKS